MPIPSKDNRAGGLLRAFCFTQASRMVYNTGVIGLVISTTLLGYLALTQAGPSVPQVAPVPYETPEAYEVYAAILPSEWSWTDAKAKRLVIRASTIHYNMCLEPDADSAKLIGIGLKAHIVM